MIRETVHTAFLLVGLALAVAHCSACSALTPSDGAGIAKDAVSLGRCQAKVHACKLDAGDAAAATCWPVYDACVEDAGLADGGAK